MPLSNNAAASKDRATAERNPTFEHRHFAAIAAILADARGRVDYEQLVIMREMFADQLAKTNPRFDRKRFLQACCWN